MVPKRGNAVGIDHCGVRCDRYKVTEMFPYRNIDLLGLRQGETSLFELQQIGWKQVGFGLGQQGFIDSTLPAGDGA